MIIQCESCSRKFIVKDSDIPEKGRNVQCGYCSVVWHQMPNLITTKEIETKKPILEKNEPLSVDSIKASDGKTYKFLGSQWAQLLPSGKTGLFAKKKIGRELDKLTGRKTESFLENLDLLATKNSVEVYNKVRLNYTTGSLQADKIDYDFETKNFKVSMFNDKTVKMKLLK